MKSLFRYLAPFVLALFSFSTLAAGDNHLPKVKLETSHGDIIIELNAEKAPNTVANFLDYVNSGHYNGTIFHRVIKDFMIQGGGFNQDFEQKSVNAPIKNEANNGLTNDKGTIAMARTGDPHSATAQFFINTVDNDFLNFRGESGPAWGYAVFGKVIEGMDTVDAIRAVTTGSHGHYQDVPQDAVVITSAVTVD